LKDTLGHPEFHQVSDNVDLKSIAVILLRFLPFLLFRSFVLLWSPVRVMSRVMNFGWSLGALEAAEGEL